MARVVSGSRLRISRRQRHPLLKAQRPLSPQMLGRAASRCLPGRRKPLGPGHQKLTGAGDQLLNLILSGPVHVDAGRHDHRGTDANRQVLRRPPCQVVLQVTVKRQDGAAIGPLSRQSAVAEQRDFRMSTTTDQVLLLGWMSLRSNSVRGQRLTGLRRGVPMRTTQDPSRDGRPVRFRPSLHSPSDPHISGKLLIRKFIKFVQPFLVCVRPVG